jgi:hypothetical protein
LARAKTAETADFDLVSGLKGLNDTVENRLDNLFGFFAWKARTLDHFFDEVGLGHGCVGHRITPCSVRCSAGNLPAGTLRTLPRLIAYH